jgi:glycosyltransferase involved in cell wall biosynthesis
MDVGIVTPRYPPNVQGGGERSAKMLAEQLRNDPRIDRTVVLAFDGSATETVGGVEVRRLRPVSSTLTEWQNLLTYGPLAGHAPEFDLLHAYNMELHPAVGRLASKGVVGTVATLNSYHFLRKSVANATATGLERAYELVGYPTTGRVLRRYMGRIDTFVALSTTVRDIYADHGLDRGRIEVIPNMYDPSFPVPEVDSGADGTVRVLNVGELTARKGVEYLVRAFAELPPGYELRVVGDGPLRSDLERLTADLGLGSRVEFAGRIPYEEIAREYATANVFAHPGVWPEPFSRTVVEAMQAGLPVVSTDVGGHTDVLPSELQCPSKDPAALAETIGLAAEDPEGHGRRNREYVTSELSPVAVVERIVDLYERRLTEA